MKALLIPSALLVPSDMRNKFGELPTALFPLGNKTMIERLYDKSISDENLTSLVRFLFYPYSSLIVMIAHR